jgi:uncharacterized membrane protein
MTQLILGLILFLGAHSVRIVADDWRTQKIEACGEKVFKGVYTVASLLGFYLLVVGYGEARLETVALWTPPTATRHISVLLMLFASILLMAAYVPRNHLKMRLGHPMVLSVKVWALAHLLANGNLADVVLFGAFLVWSVLNFKSARARDRAMLQRATGSDVASDSSPIENESPRQPKTVATLIAVLLGVTFWGGMTFVLHAQWIGVSPLG